MNAVGAPRALWQRLTRLMVVDAIRRTVIIVVVLVCLAGLVVAFSRTQTGEPDVVASGIVELQFPAPESEVLRQAQLGIDLTSAWTGTLAVNGTEIPSGELQLRPELNQILFTPGEGQTIEQLPPGRNCVQAIVWRVEETRANSRTIEWCFEVT